jgi:hypothetical protein
MLFVTNSSKNILKKTPRNQKAQFHNKKINKIYNTTPKHDKFNKGTIYKRNNVQNINTNKTYNSLNTSILTYEWCYSKQLQTNQHIQKTAR